MKTVEVILESYCKQKLKLDHERNIVLADINRQLADIRNYIRKNGITAIEGVLHNVDSVSEIDELLEQPEQQD